MARDVVMGVDGIEQVFHADDINTSGGVRWIPEEDSVISTATIRENGQYEAQFMDCYGLESVLVLVDGGGEAYTVEEGVRRMLKPSPSKRGEGGTGAVVGRARDGEMYYAYADEDGYIQKVKIPWIAKTLREPNRTLYSDGGTISYDGMAVGLYYANGSLATDWDGGVIMSGTDEWAAHVYAPVSVLHAEDGYHQTVLLFVRPFWYLASVSLPAEAYGLRFVAHVTVGD